MVNFGFMLTLKYCVVVLKKRLNLWCKLLSLCKPDVCVVMRRTGPLEPNAPKEEEIPSRSEARSHSAGFHQTAQTGSWQNKTMMNKRRKWWGVFKTDWERRKEMSILEVIQWTSSNILLRKDNQSAARLYYTQKLLNKAVTQYSDASIWKQEIREYEKE